VTTLSWREDPEIRARLRLVDQVYGQPAHRGLDIVNRQLKAVGQPEISLDQYYTDRQHVREILAQESPQGLAEHMVRLQRKQAEIERDINQTPPGPNRAALYAVWSRLEEDVMKIDGTWGGQREPAGLDVDVSAFGPSPQELLGRGEINRVQYQEYLVLLARTTGVEIKKVKRAGPQQAEQRAPQPQTTGPTIARGGVRHGLPEPKPGVERKEQLDPLRDALRVVEWDDEG